LQAAGKGQGDDLLSSALRLLWADGYLLFIASNYSHIFKQDVNQNLPFKC